jgi:hypothetical protein
MTLEQFRNIEPRSTSLLIFYSSDNSNTVSAINIKTVDCDDKNITEILKEISEISLDINGTLQTFKVTSSEILTNYAHLTVEPKPISEIVVGDSEDCKFVYTVPPFLGTGFYRSEYQAILNNANLNRTTNFIFDVDRTNSQLEPSNYQAIMDGTATLAQFQELNYTSAGINSSRYEGAKTSKEQYGISPAFAGVSVDASIYAVTQTNDYICSQSIGDRNIEEVIVGFEASSQPSYNGVEISAEDIRIDYTPLTVVYNGTQIDPTDTVLTIDRALDIESGDLIFIKAGTPEEVMKVTGIISKTSSSTEFNVIRGYKSNINPDNTAKTFGTTVLRISKVTGTSLFKADKNQIYAISNKKVWIKENSKVYYIDEGGQVIFELETCTV